LTETTRLKGERLTQGRGPEGVKQSCLPDHNLLKRTPRGFPGAELEFLADVFLVVLDLYAVFAAPIHNDPGGLLLTIECVGTTHGVRAVAVPAKHFL